MSTETLQDIEFDFGRLQCVMKLVVASEQIPDPEHGALILAERQLDELINRLSTFRGTGGAS